MQFKTVVCGGTFDHFHKGHESLLKLTFSLGSKVVIGVTNDQYVEKSKIKNQISKIERFDKRKEAVLEFVKIQKVLDKVKIVEINDLFGPTLNKDLLIDAIVVSESTKEGAEIINKARLEKGLPKLEVFIQPMVLGIDGKEISSFRIRNGEIDREGKPYIKPVWLEKNLLLPDKLRAILAKPFGQLIKNIKDYKIENYPYLITVGDATAKAFNQEKIKTDISVIDFKIARRNEFSNIKDLGFVGNEKVVEVDNPAGSISSSLTSAAFSLFSAPKSKTILKIEGEDDLAVLPLILASPLGSFIFYGQPREGIVRVEVTEENKKRAYSLIERFEAT